MAMTVKGENGYPSYIDFINQELREKVGIDTKDVVYESKHDGTVALHPGEQIHTSDTPKDEGSHTKPDEGGGWLK